ncbi:hypothetical protein [Methanocella arvoryzae]|nr:hypothetical protein [Methanocella arvoryzae]
MQEYKLGFGEILFLGDGSHTVGIVKAARLRHVFIETEKEELVQFLGEDDLIAASCFSGGPGAKEAIQCMLYLASMGGMPLLVLPKNHPATGRLPVVLSAGERIRLTSCIVPGTHPEQDVLCGRGGLNGLVVAGIPGAVTVTGDISGITAETELRLFYTGLK